MEANQYDSNQTRRRVDFGSCAEQWSDSDDVGIWL